MRNNHKAKKLTMRISAMGLALVMVISLIGTLSTDAGAVVSLSGIEKIKNTGHLSILEIVPKADSGSIGYYVGGQEPTRNWYSQVANTVGMQARTTYANTLFTNLQNRGLMSTETTAVYDAYPLTYKGPYQEYKPWEIPSTVKPEDLTVLNLAQAEEQTVKGSFSENANGDYILDNTYVYDTSSSAEYIENAIRYAYGQRLDVTEAYYYHVDFEVIRFTDDPTPAPGEVNVDAYLASHPEVPLYTLSTASGLPYYLYAGTLKENGDFTIDIEINAASGYFIAKPDYTTISTTREAVLPITVPTGADGVVDPTFVGRTLYVEDETTEGSYTAVEVKADFKPYPNAAPAVNPQYYTQDQAHSYFAITDPETPFRKAVASRGEKPFFREETGYSYVGNGAAGPDTKYFAFTPNPNGSHEENIKYDAIYVAGGYTNNEWFKRYVMDMESDFNNFTITVNSVTPDGLTAAIIPTYDLVVISAGFDLTNGNTIQYTADLSGNNYTEIVKKPRVVDTAFAVNTSYTAGTNLLQLKSGHTTPAVTADNVYYFARTIVGTNTEVTRLATNQFHTAIKDANADNSPYKVVSDEIKYENMLRDSSQALSTEISMASCVRYIVNTHRAINKKTSLQVLDIQPAPRYDEVSNSGPLTVATVLSWLPQSMQDQLAKTTGTGHNITITHMSTAALVGKIEDITEQYDLIYIGAATTSTDLNYLDDRLGDNDNNTGDDYHYANIGAVQRTSTLVRGLLQTETFNSSDVSTTRYSGNDLTPTKRDELVAFARAKMPIVVASPLVTGGATTEETEHTLTVKLELNAAREIVATPVLSPDIPVENYTVTYDWDCWNANGTPVSLDSSVERASKIAATHGYSYSCTLRVTPTSGRSDDATSKRVLVSLSGHSSGGTISEVGGWTNGENNMFNIFAADAITNHENGTVTIIPRTTDNRWDINRCEIKYQWYANGNPVGSSTTNNTFTIQNTGVNYHCVVTIDWYNWEFTLISPTYKRTASVTTTSDELKDTSVAGTPGTVITSRSISGDRFSLDENKIDPNSLMYAALNSVRTLDNVMTESELLSGVDKEEIQKNLVNALNLSRPAIDLSYKPAQYSESLESNGTVSGNCGGDLRFDFQIENITDPDPANTRYRCELYIDQNGDGRHTADELIPGITIESITNGTTKRVTNGTLQADEDISYRVTRSLNGGQADQFSGSAAWKLQVIKEGDSTVHASEKGYAYIQPTKRTELKVLQVRSSNKKFTSNVDLSTPTETRVNGTLVDWETQVTKSNNKLYYNSQELSQFRKLYYQLYNAGMYNITVETTTVNNLNYQNGTSGTQRTKQSVFDELNGYDMIILGFQDCYGDFEMNAANAVTDYINTGKSLLFTHDTTSYWNNPNYTNSSSSRPGWGFWFNQVIRDKVGLDRYGATNPTYGKQTTASGTSTYGLVTKGVDGQIDSNTAQQLQQAGYTVAYVPGNVGYSARETQGYANSTIERNTNTNTGDNKTTTTVSQVNQGQITEYPYNLGETMTVQSTHNQYYQLNMNAEDIVVWYCLGGSTYNDEKNDATNAYYIYNRGNITYSGAGHSSTLSNDEAKLFVNTMIAAYRAGNSAANVSFRTASDDPASALLFPVQPSEDGDTSLSGEQNTYFKISDRNLTNDKTLSVKLYYEVSNGTTGAVRADTVGIKTSDDETINNNLYVKEVSLANKIYPAGSATSVSSTALSSDVLYKMVVPQEVLDYMASVQGDGKVYLVATTVIHSDAGDTTYRSFDDLTLKKLGLLRLE